MSHPQLEHHFLQICKHSCFFLFPLYLIPNKQGKSTNPNLPHQAIKSHSMLSKFRTQKARRKCKTKGYYYNLGEGYLYKQVVEKKEWTPKLSAMHAGKVVVVGFSDGASFARLCRSNCINQYNIFQYKPTRYNNIKTQAYEVQQCFQYKPTQSITFSTSPICQKLGVDFQLSTVQECKLVSVYKY